MAIKNNLFGKVWRSSLLAIAQEELSGLTHYFDADTVKYFGSRVNDCFSIFDGQMLYVRESVSHPTMGRFQRVVVFDLCGGVVFRGEGGTTEKQAVKEWEVWKIDNMFTLQEAVKHNIEAMGAELRNALRNCETMRENINKFAADYVIKSDRDTCHG